MEPEKLVAEARRIQSSTDAVSALAQASELARVYAGEKSAFYKMLEGVDQNWTWDHIGRFVEQAMGGFICYVESGLLDGVSVERQARIDVVSDILDQAQTLLDTKDVHPAAPAVLVGAALEEFLRNWCEDADLMLGNRKPGIEAFSSLLREAELVTKQDAKDLTSWGGIRNHAAHGEWEEVDDPRRIRVMLEGVNLFMRRYSS